MIEWPYTVLRHARDAVDGLRPQPYHYPHRVLFIAGLPKSGTNWLMRLLEGVPGYKVRWPRDPDQCIANHDICDDVFRSLPRHRYTVMKLHTRYTAENLAVIRRHQPKTVIMWRDLRDQCVSRYFHVLNDPEHRHHTLYKGSSKEDGLSHCIEITREHYLPWIRDWLPFVQEEPAHFHRVRYEDLRRDPHAVFKGVLSFFGLSLPDAEIQSIIDANRKTTTFDIKENLRTKKGTARKGSIGDWRNHFTPRNVEEFKRGCGEFLVHLGYEKDMAWTL